MKLNLLLGLILSLAILSIVYSVKNHHQKKGPVGSDSPPHVGLHSVVPLRRPKPIKTIPYGPRAKVATPKINSLGKKVNRNVALKDFPFKVSRCDQIILFPATYINDEDDFRVRNEGYVAITAHYTNLFNDKDGQKLISQVVSTQMRGEPNNLQGARGCIRVHGGKRQKNLNICTNSMNDANNLLDVYRDFARCRYGDNLAPIPAKVLKELMKLCGVSRVTLTGNDAAERMDKLQAMVATRNNRMLSDKAKDMLGKGNKLDKKKNQLSEAEKRSMLAKFMKNKKKKGPDYFIPSSSGNRWEKDRRSYVQYSRLRVPGSRR